MEHGVLVKFDDVWRMPIDEDNLKCSVTQGNVQAPWSSADYAVGAAQEFSERYHELNVKAASWKERDGQVPIKIEAVLWESNPVPPSTTDFSDLMEQIRSL